MAVRALAPVWLWSDFGSLCCLRPIEYILLLCLLASSVFCALSASLLLPFRCTTGSFRLPGWACGGSVLLLWTHTVGIRISYDILQRLEYYGVHKLVCWQTLKCGDSCIHPSAFSSTSQLVYDLMCSVLVALGLLLLLLRTATLFAW